MIKNLWLIPALPLVAAALSAIAKQPRRKSAAALAIGSMAFSFLLALCALAHALRSGGTREFFNFPWLQFGGEWLDLGWVLDPLSAVMLVMVSFVGLLIFIYSVGYMAHDENFTRFFCFLSLFAAAMLGLVIANSLLFLFICWELVGLTSYLLIGFWYHKPSAAAAAKKAFITTRIGDLAFLLGMVWLYSRTGTLLFYDATGTGCLQHDALARLVAQTTGAGMAVSTAIGLLIFCGAVGKSGQVPLHVWLPDAMEGPTPVSALIHAATMVAAGVFLVARVYPLMAATPAATDTSGSAAIEMSVQERDVEQPPGLGVRPSSGAFHVADGVPKAVEDYRTPGRWRAHASLVEFRTPVAEATPGSPLPSVSPRTDREARPPATISTTLRVITWVGAITAIFAASIAVAQTDIKRILAYSTVSQLGYMMIGLGVGGVAVGMFHLITHAFFKALLFMGAGSVIHACHDEQDIRRMGGLRKFMPVTFATYAIGMLALSGFPLVFSGFWSKDEILHAARLWPVNQVPFWLGLAGTFLTAFYMTRQVFFVFFGNCRLDLGRTTAPEQQPIDRGETHEVPPLSPHGSRFTSPVSRPTPHESSAVMTVPLIVLAAFSILLGFIGTPAWPWFQEFLGGGQARFDPGNFITEGILPLMVFSSAIVFAGIGLGWRLYGRKPVRRCDEPDALEGLPADLWQILRNKFWVDEIYERSVIAFNAWWSRACDWMDAWVWNGAVQLVALAAVGLSWVNRFCDEYVVNLGFDEGCRGLRGGGKLLSGLQDGRVQHYLRLIGLGLVLLTLLLIWGCQ